MRKSAVLAAAVAAVFLIFSVYSFFEALTPYVTFAQARAASSGVQVKGTLAGTGEVRTNKSGLEFILRDDAGEEALVQYRGQKPAGLEQASSIVVIGRYVDERFVADKILVKCPSKYRGVNEP